MQLDSSMGMKRHSGAVSMTIGPRQNPAAQRHEEQVRRVISMYLNQDVKVSATTMLVKQNADSSVLMHDSHRMTRHNASVMLGTEMCVTGAQYSDT